MDIANKKILVTGGKGFLGSYVVARLRAEGCTDILAPASSQYDFVHMPDVIKVYKDFGPDIVIHLAARVGGIGANRENPGKFFYDNLMMGAQLMEQARQHKVSKFVALGTVCAYPKFTPVPFMEDNLWNGYPEETNAPYGLAKKMLLVQAQAYRAQYGFNAIYLLPVNLYGPGDNFDPTSSHVIPALIRKFYEAIEGGHSSVVVWGSGKATREFLYVEDCADGIVRATMRYDRPEPVNIGSGMEISIRQLAETIGRIIGFEGELVWDPTKPDGQPKRMLDASRAEREFGFKAKVKLEEGMRKTIDWYKANYIDNKPA